MERAAALAAVRQYVRTGDLPQALEAAQPLAAGTPAQRSLEVLAANFYHIKQKEIKNTLSFQEAQRAYSQVTDGLLAVLEQLETGRFAPTVTARKSPVTWVLIGMASLLLVVAGWWFAREEQDAGCPEFPTQAGTKVLILPFERLSGNANSKPAAALRDGIREKVSRKGLPVQVALYQTAESEVSAEQASQLGLNCGADLVVHGTFAVIGADSLRVKLRYTFLKDGQQSSSAATTFEGLSNVTVMDRLRSLDDVVLALCARIAWEQNNPQLAQTWLDKVAERDTSDAPLRLALNR
jgi:TolB-like protein